MRNAETGEERELPMAGAFVAVGHVPQSEIVEGIVETDENGYVAVDGRSTRTNVPGVFAGRRPRRPHLPPGGHGRRLGCQSALDAEWYLRDNPHVPTPAALEGTGDLAEEQWFHHEPAARS